MTGALDARPDPVPDGVDTPFVDPVPRPPPLRGDGVTDGVDDDRDEVDENDLYRWRSLLDEGPS